MQPLYVVTKGRRFSPDRKIIDAIRLSLERAEKQEPGWSNDTYICILLSGTALEAIANSFGEALVANWSDFDSANTLAKHRIISTQLGMEFKKNERPWNDASWIYKMRNKLVHPKPENLATRKIVTQKEYDLEMYSRPQSKLETLASLENAQRACSTIVAIRDLYASRVPKETADMLLRDSARYHGAPHEG